jgi:hypothetical protein
MAKNNSLMSAKRTFLTLKYFIFIELMIIDYHNQGSLR